MNSLDASQSHCAGVRLTQARSVSLLESLTNVAVGFLLAFTVQGLIYPALGILSDSRTNLLIAAIFTVVSLVRSYLLRRAFERVGRR